MANQIPHTLLCGGYVHTETTSITVTYDQIQYALSTGALNGGFHHILALRNQKLNFTVETEDELPGGSVSKYLAQEFTQVDLPINFCTAILTTAPMEDAIYTYVQQENIIVEVIATAKIHKTAHKAGDGHLYTEKDGNFKYNDNINLLVFTNQALTDGGMTKALITIAEAKSAALADQAVKSVVSDGIATGSGTDGVIFTIDTNGPILGDAATSSLFGDTLAKAVRQAIKEAIA